MLIAVALVLFCIASDALTLFLTHHVFTGLGSIPVVLAWAFFGVIATAVSGLLIHRLHIGIAGVILLWIGFCLYDWSTSQASFAGVIRPAAIFCGAQIAAFANAWTFGAASRKSL
jgi:hypothetical protein